MKELEVDLESHIGKQVDLVIIAGEHSGDQHAAEILKKIKEIRPNISVAAFGGQALKAAGADLIFDMTKFSVVGLYEVLSNFMFFAKLIKQVFLWIKMNQPRAVCFVDYPGFNLRLAKMLFDDKLASKAGGEIKIFYYISPQIWAWKAKRRFQLAKFVNKMATILPFEKKYFDGTGLDVSFVGHPFADENYKSNISYNPDGPVLLLPGSRKTAVKKIFPMLLKSFKEILKQEPDRMAIVVYPDETILSDLRKILKKKTPDLVSHISFIADGENVETSAAIMSSGTMSLKCCLAGVPGAIVYKTHPMTYAIGKILVNVKFLGIANILLNRCIWKEFLQSRLRPKSVAKYIIQCLRNEKTKQTFKIASEDLKVVLSTGKDLSASEWILSSIE